MNFTARIAAFILMAALSLSAFAADNFKEIQKQMMSRNWATSEQMLKTYISEKPDSAKAHYLLAQVYEQNRKFNLAQKYLDKANAIDPSQRFASSGQADKMAARLASKTSSSSDRYARTEKPASSYQAPSYTPPRYEAPEPKVAQRSEPPATYSSPTLSTKQNSSSGGGGFLIGLLLILALAGGGYFWYVNRSKKQLIAGLDDQRRALQAQTVKQQERVADLRKKLTYESQGASDLANDVAALAAEINNTASLLRPEVLNESYPLAARQFQVTSMERQLTECESRLVRKAFNKVPNATTRAAMAEAERISQRRNPPPAPRVAPRPYTPAPEPTVVHHHHHSSDSGLATGVVLGSVLNDDTERQLRLERERSERLQRELEREREEDRRREREEEERQARRRREREREEEEEAAERRRRERERENEDSAPLMDFGGSDRDDDRSSNLDFGGSDNSNDAQMDFGGNDDDDDARRRNND